MDDDGLIRCGNPTTQITWMDAKFGETVFTPRHGKPVEVNALWYHVLRLLADRFRMAAPSAAERYDRLASRTEVSFGTLFWNEAAGCLYDVVRHGHADGAIRPNQILAVSLPHSALDRARQRQVLTRVESDLWTPYGLRSLSPQDPAYQPRFAGGPYERDRAYHQGTVWAWLIGPYVEAYLRVHDFSAAARQTMRRSLGRLIAHLDEAGLESVNEVFDGDPPHRPGGCPAQAWSVAELLRAWRLTLGPQDGQTIAPSRTIGETL
jgi:glycogen debranching enzyme